MGSCAVSAQEDGGGVSGEKEKHDVIPLAFVNGLSASTERVSVTARVVPAPEDADDDFLFEECSISHSNIYLGTSRKSGGSRRPSSTIKMQSEEETRSYNMDASVSSLTVKETSRKKDSVEHSTTAVDTSLKSSNGAEGRENSYIDSVSVQLASAATSTWKGGMDVRSTTRAEGKMGTCDQDRNAQLKRERVLIKLGGGLITKKAQLCTLNELIMGRLARMVYKISKKYPYIDLLIVHGAGSYGHLTAKKFRLHEGLIRDKEFGSAPPPVGVGRGAANEVKSPREGVSEQMEVGEAICSTQEEAVICVRDAMMTLNTAVIEALRVANVRALGFPPHQWARNTDANFDIIGMPVHCAQVEHDSTVVRHPLSFIEDCWQQGIIPVTFGDVVDCSEASPLVAFGVLSGDTIIQRLAVELQDVKRVVFGIQGVDGLLKAPPPSTHDSGEDHRSALHQQEDEDDVDADDGDVADEDASTIDAAGDTNELFYKPEELDTTEAKNVAVDDDVLIHTWSAGLTLSPDIAVHNVAIDVTGGIGFKLMNASLVTLKTRGEIKVTLINGGVMNRFIRAITGRPVRGTEVVPIS